MLILMIVTAGGRKINTVHKVPVDVGLALIEKGWAVEATDEVLKSIPPLKMTKAVK